jgi:hypothetical protein
VTTTPLVISLSFQEISWLRFRTAWRSAGQGGEAGILFFAARDNQARFDFTFWESREMDTIEALRPFVSIAETGSLSAASRLSPWPRPRPRCGSSRSWPGQRERQGDAGIARNT